MSLKAPRTITRIEKIQNLKKRIFEAQEAALSNPSAQTIDALERALAESRSFRASLKEA